MYYVKSILLFCITFLLYACSLESDGPEAHVSTDHNTYIWSLTDSVRVKVKNTGTETVYYICTGQIFLEEHKGGQIINTWQVNGFEECLAARPIEPGSQKVFTISAHEGEGSIDHFMTSPISIDSKYTFQVLLCVDKDYKDVLPFKNSRSDQIIIEP